MRYAVVAFLVAITGLLHPANAQWRTQASTQQLYEKARKEGKVIFWGPARGEVEWVSRALPKVFPGVEVEFVGDNDVVTRAIAEARGGRHRIDVMWNSVTASVPLVQRNLIAVLNPAELGVANPQMGFNGQMLYVNKALYAVAFDPKRTNEADVPRRWADFLDPKFKGRMTSSLFLLPRLTGGLGLAWGEDKALAWVRNIVTGQDTLLTRAPRETFVESGERALALGEIESTYSRHALEGKIFGVVIPEPVVMVQFGLLVMKNAPHPNAARLLTGWLATPEASAMRQQLTGARDYSPASTEPLAQRLHGKQMEAVFDLPDNMQARDAVIRKATPIVAGRAK